MSNPELHRSSYFEVAASPAGNSKRNVKSKSGTGKAGSSRKKKGPGFDRGL
jgi:hypothetical protein